MSCFGEGKDEEAKEQLRKTKAINDQLKKDKEIYRSTHRLLLLGELSNNGNSSLCCTVSLVVLLCCCCCF